MAACNRYYQLNLDDAEDGKSILFHIEPTGHFALLFTSSEDEVQVTSTMVSLANSRSSAYAPRTLEMKPLTDGAFDGNLYYYGN